MQWFYADNGQQTGPVDEAGLRGLYLQGVIHDQTLVWCPALPDWAPFEAVRVRIDPAAPPQAEAAVYVCSECLRPFAFEQVLMFGDAPVCGACKNVFLRRVKQGTLPELGETFAGFWIRAGAKIIDWVVLAIFQGTFALIVNAIEEVDAMWGLWSGLMLSFVGMFLMLLYTTYFLGKFGATPGKLAFGLQVITADGEQPTYLRALARSLAEFISMFTFYLGYIMVSFDAQRRALHDYVCDTRVVRL